nr:hypothetical protein ISGA_12405 [Gordonia sp. NB41Y]
MAIEKHVKSAMAKHTGSALGVSPTRARKQVSEVLVTTIGVGVAQMVARPGELEGNLATAEMLLQEMAGQGAQIVVLPELFATSYDIEQAAAMVRREMELVLPRLTSLAATLGLTIATTVLAGDGRDGTLCNLAVVIDRRGVIATAGKQMLWAGESTIFAPDHGPRAWCVRRVPRSASQSAMKPDSLN